MLAERKSRGQSLSLRALAAAVAIGLGLAGVAVGSASAADDASVVRLAIAIPIVVPASADEFIDADTLAQFTAEQGLLSRELDAAYGRPVALGIDPRIIASIRLLGAEAPASAVAWLDRLESAPNETFELGYADADVTLQTQGGSNSVLKADGFDFAILPERFAPPATAATPAPIGDPSLPALPTSDSISDWPYTVEGLAWPRDDTVIASDLPVIAASNYSTTVLSSNNIARDASAGAMADVAGIPALVSDAAVSAALRTASAAVLPGEWDAAVADLSAAIAASARVQAGSPTLFATLDRTIPLGGSRVADTIDAIVANPAVQLVPLTEVMGTAASAGSVIDEPQLADRVSRVGQMILAESAEHAFASVASDPSAITAERRVELLTLLSSQWVSNLGTWPEAADAFTTASIALRNSVHLVKSSNFLLVADNDQYLPITVDNALDQAVTVYITVTSQSALLVIDKQVVSLPIDAASQAKTNIPVHSLSNGVVEVDVSLASATGVAIGAPVSSQVNVQAGWETPIVIAIAVIVVLVFGAGIVRTVIRRRRDNRLEAGSD